MKEKKHLHQANSHLHPPSNPPTSQTIGNIDLFAVRKSRRRRGSGTQRPVGPAVGDARVLIFASPPFPSASFVSFSRQPRHTYVWGREREDLDRARERERVGHREAERERESKGRPKSGFPRLSQNQ